MKHVGVARAVEVTALPAHGVAVIESHHAARFEPATLSHAFAKFILVIEGSGVLRAGGRQYPLREGVLAHVPAGVAHGIEDRSPPLALYAACYAPEQFDAELTGWRSPSSATHWALGDVAPHLRQAYRRDFRDLLHEQRERQLGWASMQRARLTEMLVRAARLASRNDAPRSRTAIARPHPIDPDAPGAARVRAYLDHVASRPLTDTLDDAAAACGLSRRRFTDCFRAVVGTTYQRHLRDRRLDRARDLLATTDLPVAAVAFEAGFDDPSHFHRVFRTASGVTPASFRSRADGERQERGQRS
jgi:AraC-like DNA-binding protein/quercetin dioxygenase-like cupin family protein